MRIPMTVIPLVVELAVVHADGHVFLQKLPQAVAVAVVAVAVVVVAVAAETELLIVGFRARGAIIGGSRDISAALLLQQARRCAP